MRWAVSSCLWVRCGVVGRPFRFVSLAWLGGTVFGSGAYSAHNASVDLETAIKICGQDIFAYADQLQPEASSLRSQTAQKKHHGAALHACLYDRPVPVNDAAMLTCSRTFRILLALTVLASIACLAGNTTTFYLFGFGLAMTLLLAAGTTALPLVVGHLAYEKIVAKYRGLQTAIIVVAAALCFGGLLELGQARRAMVDKATAAPTTNSYVDEAPADAPPEPNPQPQPATESDIRRTFGEAALLIMIAADLVLGLLVGKLTQLHTDEDYAAWLELKKLAEAVIALEKQIAELLASVEIAKKRCMAGILRAKTVLGKRRITYHRSLTVFLLLVLLGARTTWAQTIDRYEGILIDTSGSISRGGADSELFQEYLASTKKLLLTEPANSRVWVSTISTDSFGGVREVLKGWTPETRGVFTDDLTLARTQLAKSFAAKSSALAPVAASTDIFGALWHFKALFESVPNPDPARPARKTIWIFSDMMNETQDFPMPALIEMGADRMLEHARAKGLVVPLNGYRIYIQGASPNGLSPQAWVTVKTFWTKYFAAAGAEMVLYSTECDAHR